MMRKAWSSALAAIALLGAMAGRIPVGMSGPFFQGQDAGAVSGTPTTKGTYSFLAQVTDSAGATGTETFTINVL
jgi:hypothetical protein